VTGGTVTWTTFQASNYMVLAWTMFASDTATAMLTCDSGAVTDTLTATEPSLSFNRFTLTAYAKVYAFPTGATHTCTLTATATSGNPFNLIFAGTPEPFTFSPYGSPTAGGTRVFAGGVIYENGDAQSSTTAAFNAQTASTVTALQVAGMTNLAFVNVRNFINSTADMSGTDATLANGIFCPASTQVGLHPNDCGHQHLLDAFMAAAQPVAGVLASFTPAWTNPFAISSPDATTLAGYSTFNGTNSVASSTLGHGWLFLQAYGTAIGARLGQNTLGSQSLDLFTSNASGQSVRFCSHVNGTYPTGNSSFSCPFTFYLSSGQILAGLLATPSTIAGYHQLGVAALIPDGSHLGNGVSLLDTSGLNFGFQTSFNAAAGAVSTEMYAPNGKAVGFAFYNSTSGEPSVPGGFTRPLYCTDTICSITNPLTGVSTAPSGSCTGLNGAWVFSQDGHATYCNAGTWATKI